MAPIFRNLSNTLQSRAYHHQVLTATTNTDEDTYVHLLKQLNQMRMRGTLCNAILATTDGASFRVHKSVLSCCSNYFRILFTTSLKDKTTPGDGPHTKLFYTIVGLSSDNLEAFIKYAYSGIVDVHEDNATSLLTAADQFEVHGIADKCKRFVLEHMTPENCIGIMKFGKEFLMPDVEEEAKRFVLKNFLLILATSEEFLHLSMDFLTEILQSDRLNVTNELFVWIAIKRWCQYQYQERQHSIPKLLVHVRLALLPAADFGQIASDPRLVPYDQCWKYISIVKRYYSLGIRNHQIPKILSDKTAVTMFSPRYPYDLIFAFGGWLVQAGALEVYDNRADIWKMIPCEASPGPLTGHQVASLGQYMYVIGGSRDVDVLNVCWRFDTDSLKFQEVGPMLKHRQSHCAVVLSGKIYVMGGHDNVDRFDSVEYFDPAHKQWTYVSPMHQRRCEFGAAAVRNRIFVAGGDHFGCLESVECYFAEFDQWFVLPPMSRCRRGLGCVAVDDAVYALGGRDASDRLKTVEKYCIKDRQWIPVKPMRCPRSHFAVTVMDKKIYVMGGLIGRENESDVETDLVDVFDPAKLQWGPAAPLNRARRGSAGCAFSGLRNVERFVQDEGSRCWLKPFDCEDNKEESQESGDPASDSSSSYELSQ